MRSPSLITVQILAATILTTSIGACGSSNGPAVIVDASHDTSSTRSDASSQADLGSTTGFADQYDTAVCGMLARLQMVSGKQYCLSLVTAAYRGQAGFNSLKAHLAAVSAGKSTLDEKRAAQCIAAIESMSSFFDSSAQEACANLFHGTLADGESCIADGECQPGRVCYLASGDCAGVCKQFGSHCYYDTDCASGQVCNVISGCIAPLPPGANGQACGTNFFCQQGLICSSANTCTPPPTEGQPCDNLMCAGGLVCVHGVCTRSRSKGDACQWTGQCGGMLFSDLTCDPASHVCVDAFVGGPCSVPVAGFSFETFLGLSDHWLQWASGCDSLVSYCDRASATCVAYPTVGAACDTSSVECGPAATCKPNDSGFTEGTCTRISSCSP